MDNIWAAHKHLVVAGLHKEQGSHMVGERNTAWASSHMVAEGRQAMLLVEPALVVDLVEEERQDCVKVEQALLWDQEE